MAPMGHMAKCIKINNCVFSNYINLQSNYSGSVTESPDTLTIEIPRLTIKVRLYLYLRHL